MTDTASPEASAADTAVRDAPTVDSISRELARLFDDVGMQTAAGDLFFFAGDDRRFPFATIVTSDSDFDNLSRLDRPGIFRLNIGVSKATFQSLFPPAPALTAAAAPAPTTVDDGVTTGATAHAQTDANVSITHDLAALDRLMPHPVYGRMHWLCVLNPSAATLDRLEPLLREAHDIMAARHGRRTGAESDAGSRTKAT